MFAAATGRPDRFAALHFHTPVWLSNVAEDQAPYSGTSAETADCLVAFAHRIGQVPIRMQKESYGDVFNALYAAINRKVLTLVANGIASVQDVDRAWMGNHEDAHRPVRERPMVSASTRCGTLPTTGRARRVTRRRWPMPPSSVPTWIGAAGASRAAEGSTTIRTPSYQSPGFLTCALTPSKPAPYRGRARISLLPSGSVAAHSVTVRA